MIESPPLHETVRRLVLVADDDPVFHMIVAQVLAKFDLASLPVNDGAAAIVAVAAHRSELRGAILDIDMPNVDGIDAAHAIQRIAPELAMILMSGLAFRYYAERITHLHLAGIIQKPFPLTALDALIQHALADSAARGMPLEQGNAHYFNRVQEV